MATDGPREVDGHTIDLSNTDKVFFPDADVTKGELIDYYQQVADWLLPRVEDRPLSLVRAPDGLDGQQFFQKDTPGHFPGWVRTAAVEQPDDDPVRHVVADQAATLVFLADQGAVELHAGPCPTDDLDHPAELIYDLDPPEGSGAGEVRQAARWLHGLLADELGLGAFVKTSGSKGFHVHVPLAGTDPMDAVRSFAEDSARLLAERHPDRLTVAQRKSRRAGRVFVDWLRNHPAQTSVAPYSVRLRPAAPIATPVAWEQLSEGLDPQRYTIGNIFRRLAQTDDPWAAFGDARQPLGDAAGRLDELSGTA